MSWLLRRGLRAQILVALFLAVVLAFGLLDAVVIRLGARARLAERVRSAEATASLLAELAGSPLFDLPRFQRTADSITGRGGIRGVEIVLPNGPAFARGTVGDGPEVEVRSPDGAMVRIFLDREESSARRRESEFLFLYVALTGGGILVLTYVVLTMLVIRPIESLRRASDRLARGHLESRVEETGPAELAALSHSFNEMAQQLRVERDALVRRLGELETTTRDLRDAQEQIVRTEKLASVGRLSAGVAHEIGNPLAAILGLVELLESGELPPDEAREFVIRIRNETERIHRIIRELLDFARQGRDAEDDPSATADPLAVVREAVALVKPQKAFHRIDIEVEGASGSSRVRGGEARLMQVFLNLLLNAADAIDGAGKIAVRVRNEGEQVVVELDDDGPGIPAEVREQIFEPFVTTKPVGKGTGLGLAVCHTIVERAGGTITADNLPGRGARFTVRLPLSTSRVRT